MTTHATGGKNPPMFPLTHPYLIIAAGMPDIYSAPASQAPLDVFVAKRRGLTLQGVEDDLEVAKNPATPADDLTDLYEKSKSKKVKLAVLRNPNTSTKLLLERAEMTEDDELQAIVENPSRIMGRISNDPDWSAIETYIAMETEDVEVLRELAMHHDPDVRKFVAIRDLTPIEIKLALADDPSEAVAFFMAGDVDMPDEVLFKLAKSRFQVVKVELATNVHNEEVMRELVATGDQEILETLSKRYDLPDAIALQIVATERDFELIHLARSTRSTKVMRALSKSHDVDALNVIAERNDVPEKIREDAEEQIHKVLSRD